MIKIPKTVIFKNGKYKKQLTMSDDFFNRFIKNLNNTEWVKKFVYHKYNKNTKIKVMDYKPRIRKKFVYTKHELKKIIKNLKEDYLATRNPSYLHLLKKYEYLLSLPLSERKKILL